MILSIWKRNINKTINVDNLRILMRIDENLVNKNLVNSH